MKTSHCLISLVGFFSSLALASLARGAGLSAKGLDRQLLAHDDEGERAKEILYFIDPDKERLVVINWGARDGLLAGSKLKSMRQHVDERYGLKLWVETGELKVQQVGQDFSIAVVSQNGSEMAGVIFPDYPGMMAGDTLSRPDYVISRRQEVLPQVSLAYLEIFQDPKLQPANFELSETGKEKLRRELAVFSSKKFSLLLVKGYTDREGPADANQVESYQRALTIRQFLVDELGFDGKRVVAIGLGELDPIDESNVAGHQERNRRVVVEVVSSTTSSSKP